MPPVFETLLPHLPPFLAALSRIAGLFVFTPGLAGAMMPVRIKALLAVALTAAVYPTLDLARDVPLSLDLMSLAPAMASETLIGVSVGFLASLPLLAAQMGGVLAGQQMGMGLGNIINPALDADADTAGQLLFFAAIGAFLACGGLDACVRAVSLTFVNVPIGGAGLALASPLNLAVALVASGFEVAVRISAPVLCILLVESLASAFLMKTAPQFNIMSFGFPVRITLGLGAMYASLGAAHEVMSNHTGETLRAALEWARTLGAPAGGV